MPYLRLFDTLAFAAFPVIMFACMQSMEPGTTIAPPTTNPSEISTISAPEATTKNITRSSTSTSSSSTTSTTISTSTITSTTTSTTTATTSEKICGGCAQLMTLVELRAGIIGIDLMPIQPTISCTGPGAVTVTCKTTSANLVTMEINPEKTYLAAPADKIDLPLTCKEGVLYYSPTGAPAVTLVACGEVPP